MISLEDALADGRGIERPFNCPVHDDSTASASVNITTGLWYCFACNATGSAENFVPEAHHILARLTEEEEPRIYPPRWLDIFDAHHTSEYWSGRYGEAVSRKYRCGTDPETGFPTYPVLDRRSRVLGVVQRTDFDPKYLYPSGISVSTTLYLSPTEVKPHVMVFVEGASDVMALDQGGLPQRWQAAGTYGAGLHAAQRQLVLEKSPKFLIFAFDGDQAGHNAIDAAETWCNTLGLPFMSYPWDNVEVKDPGDLEADQRIPALVEAMKENGHVRYT